MGSGILGRAFFQAYHQAIANASKTGVAQEAMQNAKYDKLFENNAKAGSFYLQSKVLRAKECLEVVYRSNGTSS
ncbi:unnamed protein product [Eruca vesicaria subsp. sativa]|uniref:Uncharacterized protein n=1 Tax=Eruca vesicaria subsp. sativa TaxID=29727 RepID=A0ABC8K6Y6_ERUVS|nr:unnamed protein product [Eruca vesicaria subsp. sativa]